MGFKSSGVAVESVVFNDRKYYRYPESDNPAHRRYFARSGHRLHRDVWKHHNGPIPAGMHIHHIDGDTANNDISNLACITSKQHWDEHRAESSERNKRPQQLEQDNASERKSARGPGSARSAAKTVSTNAVPRVRWVKLDGRSPLPPLIRS